MTDIPAAPAPHKLDLVPVYGDGGEVVLYDIHIDGEWMGSRRTKDIAMAWLESKGLGPFEGAGGPSRKLAVKPPMPLCYRWAAGWRPPFGGFTMQKLWDGGPGPRVHARLMPRGLVVQRVNRSWFSRDPLVWFLLGLSAGLVIAGLLLWFQLEQHKADRLADADAGLDVLMQAVAQETANCRFYQQHQKLNMYMPPRLIWEGRLRD